MADETLLQLAKGVRGKTLRILDGVSEEQAVWLPAGLHNHILWNAGHALIVVEHLGVSAATARLAELLRKGGSKFSWKSWLRRN